MKLEGGGGAEGRTIARNVYARLLLARKERKFIVENALKRRSVSFTSDL